MLTCSPVWQMSMKTCKFLRIWPSLWNNIINVFWAVSSVAGTKVSASLSSLPSPPSWTPTPWQKHEPHNTYPRKTQGSHLAPKNRHSIPAWNVFSPKLAITWIGKVLQGLRCEGTAMLVNWGAEPELPTACRNSGKAQHELDITLNNSQATRGPAMN